MYCLIVSSNNKQRGGTRGEKGEGKGKTTHIWCHSTYLRRLFIREVVVVVFLFEIHNIRMKPRIIVHLKILHIFGMIRKSGLIYEQSLELTGKHAAQIFRGRKASHSRCSR